MIDSHVHVWVHDPEYPWSVNETDIPSYNASPKDLLRQMQGSGVRQAVLVQFIKYRWDNLYAAHVMKTAPRRFQGVCRVNPESPDSPDRLSYWTVSHGFRGVRLSPETDARGDWFCGRLMPPLFQRAAALRVPVIILTKPPRLPDLAAILEKVPEVDVIIDHLGDCLNAGSSDLETLLGLAKYPRLFLKIGHIPQSSAEAFPWRDTHASMQRIFQAYGAHRLMWGSDWPFCLSRMTYAQSIAFLQQELKFLTADDREWVLGKTAGQFWPFVHQEGAV
jgi:predicted TIM-barrel fold metal-dependent hydrolase